MIIPADNFLTIPVELAGHIALVREKGAAIQATDKFGDFGRPIPCPDPGQNHRMAETPPTAHQRWSGLACFISRR